MTTQLTLTLDTALLAQAEAAARAAGLDLTAFLEKPVQEALPPAAPTDDLPPLPPGVQALRGILSLPPDTDYKQLAGCGKRRPAGLLCPPPRPEVSRSGAVTVCMNP